MATESWSGPLIVKGIQHVDDARMVVDLGADAVVVSNHGAGSSTGRLTPLEVLPRWSTRSAIVPRSWSTAG